MTLPQNNYINILNSLKEKIRQRRYKAASVVNAELLKLYWEIGKTIIEQQKEEGWGAKIIDKLAFDLKKEFPDFKGLSVRNLKYMRAFAEAYPAFLTIVQPEAAQIKSNKKDTNNNSEIVQGELALISVNSHNEFVQPVVAQIPWTHHTIILDKVKTVEERAFYIEKTFENGWSKSILSIQIESKLYQRTGSAITNFKQTLPDVQSDLAQQTLKNPYVFDFLSFGEEIKEREFEKALIQHLKKFMLELGKGFAYVGNQKNIVVEGDDFFLDLLFYNYHLHCFVVIELKVGDFKPEFAGKLNFYVNTVNEQLKGVEDKPSIGILLCKTPNETVVKYSLQGIESPIGVADYQFAHALPKQLKGEMPSIEELEAEIEKEYEELKSPTQKRFDTLKEKLSKIKGNEIQQIATKDNLTEIVDKSLIPLSKAIIAKMEDFRDLFVSQSYYWQLTNTIERIEDLAFVLKDEEYFKKNQNFFLSYRFNGFKKAGTEAFGCHFDLNYKFNIYCYEFNIDNQQPILKKLYHEQLTPTEIEYIVELAYNKIIDSIERQIEFIKPEKI